MVVVAFFIAHVVYAQDGVRREEGVTETPVVPTLTTAPSLLEAAAPNYPPAAAAAGITAEVKVRIRIEADGTVSTVEVLEEVGNGFDEAAVAAARQYLFKPAYWDGVPGPIVVETQIHFVLQEVEEDDPEPATTTEPSTTANEDPAHGGDSSQKVSIEGVALERGSRRKLAGVIVSIAELGVDVITDAKGRFYFHGVGAGTYELLAIDDKYDRFRRKIELGTNEAVDLKLYLRAKGGNPYETVVEGEREILEVTRRTLQRRQLTTVPGTFGDPIRVIQSLPGLARTPFTTGFLLIRGSNPDDSGVYIDGHRVPLLFHFLGGPSILNAEFLDQIDLYPGGYPARYGRSIGGVVSVDTRSSKSDGIHGSGDIDLLDTSGYLRFPLGDNASVAMAGRRSYLDVMLGFFLPDAKPGQTLRVVPVYYDYQLRFDYDFGSNGKASLFFIRSSDVLDVLQADADEESALAISSSINFNRLIGKYQRKISGGLRLTISPAVGIDSVAFAGAPGEGEEIFTGLEIDVENLSYRMRVDGKLGDHFYLDTGLDLESRITRYELLIPAAADIRNDDNIDLPPELFIRNVDTLMLGAYADLAIDLGKLRLIPGLRFDGYLLNAHQQWSVDPRLVGRYQFTNEVLGKSYVGLFHQPPQPEALDAEFGNPNLEAEKAVHLGLGAEWKFAPRWNLDLEGYFIDRKNQVAFTSETTVDPNTGNLEPVYYLNSRVGDTVGLEMLLKREVTRNLFGWVSYTLSSTRHKDRPGQHYRVSSFDQRHTLNMVASYTTNGGWEFGSRFRLSTGRPITEVVGGTFNADEADYDRVQGGFNAARRKTFQQLDARIEKTWLYNTWRLGLYLDVQNLLNASNEEGTQYDYRFRESAPVSGVPFLPTLGIRGQF